MFRFAQGFGVASVLWAAAAAYFAWSQGLVGERDEVTAAPERAVDASDDAGPRAKSTGHAKQGRRARRARTRAKRGAAGAVSVGDDLGSEEPRTVQFGQEGGEEQLSSADIGAVMDGAFPQIRRCLMLAATDTAVTGTLTFGLRIEPDGRVGRVRLRGPALITASEAGDCLRSAARNLRFRSFDGPPMITHYPITLD